jgi:hypothetical protein
MQMHYNLSNWDGAPDQTALQFSTSTSVGTEAKISKLLDPRWVAGDLNIPAGDDDVVATFELPNPSQRTLSLYSAGLHMHNLGKSGSLKLRHADGSEECLLEIPEWDFHWQGSYFFETEKELEPDASLILECHWDNSAGSTDVGWGEGSADEMCLGTGYLTL